MIITVYVSFLLFNYFLHDHHLRVYYDLTTWPAPSWLDSSVGRALHRYCRGCGFESHWILSFSGRWISLQLITSISCLYFSDDHCRCLYMCGLLTKCEVKMAGYWPSSFFACLWAETKSTSINSQKKWGQYPAILTEQARSIKDFLYGFQGNFSCGIQRVVPSGQNSYIFPSREANHSARFGTSCLLTKTSHIIFIKVIKSLCHFLSLSLCR